MKKQATGVLSDPIISLTQWDKLHGGKFGHKNASFSKIAGNTSKYLLSHVTIMASVMCEKDPTDWLIVPECSYLVNNNDDGWENTVLKMSYRSFVGAFNFLEHYQNSKAAKGHILDAVLRKIHLNSEVWAYFVDLLVATDLSNEDLVHKIRSEKIKYLSMGCTTDLVVCSYCGQRVTDNGNYCSHLQYNKGSFLPDDDGIPRRVAELCGHKTLPNGGVRFIEASWVAIPAFPGASVQKIISTDWEGPKTAFTKDAELLDASGHRTSSKAASQLVLPKPSALTAELGRLKL
jgi:hypothetical protein